MNDDYKYSMSFPIQTIDALREDNPPVPILLNHDFSAKPIGLMRQSGARLDVELDEPLSPDQVFKIFGEAGIWILERDDAGKVKRFQIVEFSLCAAAAAPAGWQPIETAPKDGTKIIVGF